jgi:hypothetical protein
MKGDVTMKGDATNVKYYKYCNTCNNKNLHLDAKLNVLIKTFLHIEEMFMII